MTECADTNMDSNTNTNTKIDFEDELALKSESDHAESQEEFAVVDRNTDNNSEEKEGSHDLELSYCRGLSKTPLAVPMVATTLDKSVTRNDAKAITSTRLKRLKQLSQKPEETLSRDQKHEKKRIIRLEKNRRAAAMSRRKKKMYVKNLEDKCALMARHLAILEMENAQLRAVLNAQSHHQMIPFKIPNMTHFQVPPSATTFSASSNNSDATNSMEPHTESTGSEPSLKRRKLNNGTSYNTTATASCDNTSDHDISLEPLPIHGCDDAHKHNILVPPPPPLVHNFMPMQPPNHLLPPNRASIHHPRVMPFRPRPYHEPSKMKEQSDHEDDMPPEIDIPSLTVDDVEITELPILDDIIDETVDECGSVDVVAFLPPDMKGNTAVYL
eukprot:146095_1